MATGTLVLNPRLNSKIDAVLGAGSGIFAFAIVALGVETLVCSRVVQQALGPGYNAIPVLPWVPAIPWVAIVAGAIWTACGAGILLRAWPRNAALTLGTLYTLAALVIVLPHYVAHPGDMGLRTVVFEPLALASIAFLLPGRDGTPAWLARASRIVFGLSMVVFGVDHFLALKGIGSLVPSWIPWHVFWIAFFGVVFIAGGVGIGIGKYERLSWAAIGLMFAVWVITLHLPRTLGWYHIPGAITDPNEWSSMFIAVGLWGGSSAIARSAMLGSEGAQNS